MSGYEYYFEDSITYRNQSSKKYFGFSVVLHSTLLIAAFFISVPVIEKIKSEPIIVEFDALQTPKVIPPPVQPIHIEKNKGHDVAPTRGAKTAFSPAPSAPMEAKDSDIISGPVKTSKLSKSKIAKLKTKTSGGVAKKATYVPSRAGVPETIEDIPAPKLDFDSVAVAQTGNLGDDAFENEFKNIDKANDAAVRAEKARLDNEAKQIADENDASLKSLENKIASDSRAMQDSLTATRNKNAATLAQIRAAEKAAATKAAREAAENEAKLKSSLGSGTGNDGLGKGSTGENRAAKVQAGSPNAVRSIDQLRQMPGNPKPNYSVDERLNRQQGRVIFQAFVTEAGALTNFRLVESTGYKNLDGKSLAVLKKWKFYPGQQGWVEIPQVWTLKGDVEQMPALLKRQASTR